MFTYVAKCTNNYISVPSTPVDHVEVILPVVVAKTDESFIFSTTKLLPLLPEKIKSIKVYIQDLKYEVINGYVIIDVTVRQDVFYVSESKIMVESFLDTFSRSLSIPQAKKGMHIKADTDVEVFYKNFEFEIFEKLLINLNIQLLEYRNIVL